MPTEPAVPEPAHGSSRLRRFQLGDDPRSPLTRTHSTMAGSCKSYQECAVLTVERATFALPCHSWHLMATI